MEKFTIVLTLAGLLLSVLGCKPVKEGPFTFTNKTGSEVHVLITQSKTVQKTLQKDETHTGEDYFTPKIVFLNSSSDNKISNKYTATTDNGFDYKFENATSSNISISLKVPSDFTTTYKDYEKWTLKEVNGKLGDTTVKFSEFKDSSSSTPPLLNKSITDKKLYTDTPEFRIYDDKSVDVISSFTVNLEKGDISPGIWTLEIIYPKIE